MIVVCAGNTGFAAVPTCDARAAEKKLDGAAKTSVTEKCVSDAMAAVK